MCVVCVCLCVGVRVCVRMFAYACVCKRDRFYCIIVSTDGLESHSRRHPSMCVRVSLNM